MTILIEELAIKFPDFISIEDGMAENDWDGWSKLTNNLNKKIQLVGDDVFVTNKRIFKKGIDHEIFAYDGEGE